jgi:hypothetical protein
MRQTLSNVRFDSYQNATVFNPSPPLTEKLTASEQTTTQNQAWFPTIQRIYYISSTVTLKVHVNLNRLYRVARENHRSSSLVLKNALHPTDVLAMHDSALS